MPKHNLLVADADPRTLRILDVALRRAGFAVATAGDGGEALRRIQRAVPDLVLADTGLPTQDGFELCRTLRADERFGTIPILLMSSDRDPDIRIRAGEAGADDFFEKPVLVKEMVVRVRELIAQRVAATRAPPVRAPTPAALSGSVGDLGLVDLFNSLETWQKNAIIHCEDGERTARIWVQAGQVVDAEVENLAGEAAFYRLLSWEKGTFRVEFGSFPRTSRTEAGTQALLLEGMRRIDEAARLADLLPPTTVLGVDFDVLARRLGDLPDEVNGVLRLVDGRRTLREVIAGSSLDDLSTLAVVQRLLADGVVRKEDQPAKEEASKKPSLDEWLGSEPMVWTPAPKPQDEQPATSEARVDDDLEEVSAEPLGPPPPDLRIVHFPAATGTRRERLVRENAAANEAIAAGKPVRLTRIVEMPPAPDGSDAVPEERRRASDAVGEVAQRFAPDPVLARVIPWAEQRWRTWTPADKGGGIAPPPRSSVSAAVGEPAPPRIGPATPPSAPSAIPAPPLRETTAPPAPRATRRWIALVAIACAGGAVIAISFRPWRTATVVTPAPPPVAETTPPAAPPVEAKSPPAPAKAAASPAQAQAAPPRLSSADEYSRALQEGESLLQRGRYRAAAQELRKAVQIDGKSVPALLSLGDALLEADDARSALAPLQQAAALDPRSARAHLLLGTAYQSVGRKADALKAYRRYLDLEPQGEFAGDVRAILTNLARSR
jgi:CheY-like chemotaxis protein